MRASYRLENIFVAKLVAFVRILILVRCFSSGVCSCFFCKILILTAYKQFMLRKLASARRLRELAIEKSVYHSIRGAGIL